MKQDIKIDGKNVVVWNPDKAAPVLLAFHGNGEKGTSLSALYGNGFPQLFTQGFVPPKDVYIVCPQAPDGAYPAADIPALLTKIKALYPLADVTKTYTTGFSFGGQTVMEGLVHKPTHALPMSAAGGGNTLVNFIADNKIPITHWTGGNEPDNIGWTLYQINQKVPGLTKTITRPGIGHCCWNEVLKSSAFWDLVDSVVPTPTPTPVPTPQPEPEPTPTPTPQPNPTPTNGQIKKVVCGEYLTGYITNDGKLFVNKWKDAYNAVECADTGLSNIVDGIGGQYDIMVVDSAGLPTVVSVDNGTLSVVKRTAPVTGATAANITGMVVNAAAPIFNLFGAYFAVSFGSLYTWGIDRLKVGATMQNAVKLNMPAGKTIVKVTGASSTGLGDFTIYGLASDGTVWKWIGLNPTQVLFPGNIARDITTVGPYAIVVETASDLFAWGGANPAIVGLAWNQKTPVSIKKQYTDAGAVFPTK
ncbi:MAG TPA: hypothetical protein PLY79_10390, partial [Ferruginibacter sp.]|nr:hypothetical protein [Ferruginibacter sp.]